MDRGFSEIERDWARLSKTTRSELTEEQTTVRGLKAAQEVLKGNNDVVIVTTPLIKKKNYNHLMRRGTNECNECNECGPVEEVDQEWDSCVRLLCLSGDAAIAAVL